MMIFVKFSLNFIGFIMDSKAHLSNFQSYFYHIQLIKSLHSVTINHCILYARAYKYYNYQFLTYLTYIPIYIYTIAYSDNQRCLMRFPAFKNNVIG